MSISERLQAARKRFFFGRDAEQALFKSALYAPELSFYLLHIFGPGGVGKSTLLHQFEALAQAADVPAIYLDGRYIDATPASFCAAIAEAMGIPSEAECLEVLAHTDRRTVLLVDTYERLGALDRWLRQSFLPSLSGNILTVIASRFRPTEGWRSDTGWKQLLRTVSLRNLSRSESEAYLRQYAIPEKQHASLIKFTHGHPLALSLVADAFAQQPTLQFDQNATPDIVKSLLERIIEGIPDPFHRAAIEACCLVRSMQEGLLAAIFPEADPHALFEWLRSLSFIYDGPHGLYPHDLARQVIVADLRWRNNDWYRELHDRVRAYYGRQLPKTHGQQQQHILIDYIYLHRDNPIVRPFFHQLQESQGEPSQSVHLPTADVDLELLIEMVAEHEGDESASMAAHWFEQQPENLYVFQDEKGEPNGFLFHIELERASAAAIAADPATRKAYQFLSKNAPLRADEKALYFRFWMAAETYQSISPVQSLIAVNAVRHYLTTPGIAYSFFPCADPDFWTLLFTYADLHRQRELDFRVGGRTYGVFTHDWRVVSPAAWLDLLAERETASSPQSVKPPKVASPLVVLSQSDFATAVREALDHFTRPDLLAQLPLVRSRLVVEKVNENTADVETRVAALQAAIIAAANTLQNAPRDLKFYRALYHTYFQPAPTQESAAELLDIPYSTFRRHLKRGIDQLTAQLWQQEIGA